jgi:hypothetical protein
LCNCSSLSRYINLFFTTCFSLTRPTSGILIMRCKLFYCTLIMLREASFVFKLMLDSIKMLGLLVKIQVVAYGGRKFVASRCIYLVSKHTCVAFVFVLLLLHVVRCCSHRSIHPYIYTYIGLHAYLQADKRHSKQPLIFQNTDYEPKRCKVKNC